MKPSALASTFSVLFAFGLSAIGQSATQDTRIPNNLIPSGFVVTEEVRGDLNRDNQEDRVYIIKGTNKEHFFKHEYRGMLDRNRRGIIIALQNRASYEVATKNLECFSSENEDGGVYFAPELDVSIVNGILILYYEHGRYGNRTFKFRRQNSEFELVGYESSQYRSWTVLREVSINLSTKRMRIRENIDPESDGRREYKFKETWKSVSLLRAITLRAVKDFDEIDLEDLTAQSKRTR